uniref:Uncharacterized protein n=1 Tax=Anguilla anguilla TaxID=7936 RepID=A0A0E9S7V7_ANGAN
MLSNEHPCSFLTMPPVRYRNERYYGFTCC